MSEKMTDAEVLDVIMACRSMSNNRLILTETIRATLGKAADLITLHYVPDSAMSGSGGFAVIQKFKCMCGRTDCKHESKHWRQFTWYEPLKTGVLYNVDGSGERLVAVCPSEELARKEIQMIEAKISDRYCHPGNSSEKAYEDCLLWLARVQVYVEDSYNNRDQTQYFNMDEYRLVGSQLEKCTLALGSQGRLWREASARLSADPGDFGIFEMRRAVDTLRLPEMTDKLRRLVDNVFGKCPGANNG